MPSASLPAVASPLQDKPSAAESVGAGAAAPTCDSKILKVGCTAVAIRESASARRLAERQWRFFQMKVGAKRRTPVDF
jgi:hypothetical protein